MADIAIIDQANTEAELNEALDRVAALEQQANCGEGHDPTRICCAHAGDVKRLRARVAELEPIVQAAADYVTSCLCNGGTNVPELDADISEKWQRVCDAVQRQRPAPREDR